MSEAVVGIIAEYNPLHNGHFHHLARAREESGARGVVVVLSSYFVQRGEPAMVDKWARTAMALACGADVVLELPTVFSCHNAGVFANAAVDLLAALGGVTHVAFGMEEPQGDLETLGAILMEEPEAFKSALQRFLQEGFSFVESRSRALETLVPGSASLLRGSNNTLALAYCCRIWSRGYALRPVRIQRVGAGYHHRDLAPLASATAVREALRRGDWGSLALTVPPASAALLRQARERGRTILDFDFLWRLTRFLIPRLGVEGLRGMAEMREGIEHLLMDAARRALSWDDLVQSCVSRRYPRGRVQRHILHILLGLKHWENRALQRLGPPYLRVLGVTPRGREILRRSRPSRNLPLIAKASPPPGRWAQMVMAVEHRSAALWELGLPHPEAETESRRRVVLGE
ncbi:MAG TPA: nucleotidyltransferase family protein [Synergistaceae bacterium]|nr:nucleotidyltransferase family protein [Synergistaceae bacterium]